MPEEQTATIQVSTGLILGMLFSILCSCLTVGYYAVKAFDKVEHSIETMQSDIADLKLNEKTRQKQQEQQQNNKVESLEDENARLYRELYEFQIKKSAIVATK